MIKRVIGLCTALLVMFCCAAAHAEQAYDLIFRKHGGGQFIYCNNPEFVTASDLSTDENPDSTYMMNNTALKPGKYSMFFCFVNYAGFDIEPDVEFKSSSEAEVTIDAIGYYVPQSVEYWDCIGAWSDLMGIDIRPLNGTEQYVHYSGERNVPAKITLNNSSDWASRYIYNYERLAPRTTFNMLINFTIESGEVDVNCAALKYYGVLGDRSHHNPNAAYGKYINDSTVKGIDTETLPVVETDLDIEITPDMRDGKDLNLKIYNQFHPEGNIVPFWTNNINPARDATPLCKNTAVSSDMLNLTYVDDSKLSYYGKNVPQDKRDNIWRMDIYHCDTLEYNSGIPQNPDDYIPNMYTGEKFDNSAKFNPILQFNLGNFGVVNRHNLRITNSDSTARSINYLIRSTRASNIAILRDKEGNILNPYTHKKENPYAISRPILDEMQEVCMFSALLQPGETREYILDVVLTTNCYGGQHNILRVDSKNLLENKPATEFPDYSEVNDLKNVFYTGAEYMKWENKKLMRKTGNKWSEVKIPGATMDLFAELDYEVSLVKTDRGYAARYCAWDRFPDTQIADRGAHNKVYFLDNNFDYLYPIKFSYYIYNMSHSNHTLYVQSDVRYESEDNTYRRFKKSSDAAMPVSNGKYTLSRPAWPLMLSTGGSPKKVCFETEIPPMMYSTGGIFYYKKEYQEYVTDTDKKNVLALSPNGVTWYTRELSPQLLELLKVYDFEDGIYVGTKYGKEKLEQIDRNAPVIQYNGEYLAFNTVPEMKNGTLMAPMNFTMEQMGAKVVWLGAASVKIIRGGKVITLRFGGKTAEVDGVKEYLGAAPYVKDNQLMLPLRFMAKQMDCTVKWDEKTNTAVVSSK